MQRDGTCFAGAMLASGALDTTRVTVRDPVPASRKKTGSVRVASELILDAPWTLGGERRQAPATAAPRRAMRNRCGGAF